MTSVSYDYIGYGMSEGEPSEENCLKSLSLVVDYYNNYKELLIGQSLGTGVVVDYVSTNEWTLPIISKTGDFISIGCWKNRKNLRINCILKNQLQN